MSTITITAEEKIEINRDTWRFWQEDAGYYEGLALDVHLKIEAGLPLSDIEQRILCIGLTQEHVKFVKGNL